MPPPLLPPGSDWGDDFGDDWGPDVTEDFGNDFGDDWAIGTDAIAFTQVFPSEYIQVPPNPFIRVAVERRKIVIEPESGAA